MAMFCQEVDEEVAMFCLVELPVFWREEPMFWLLEELPMIWLERILMEVKDFLMLRMTSFLFASIYWTSWNL